jgi:hypothetical protein
MIAPTNDNAIGELGYAVLASKFLTTTGTCIRIAAVVFALGGEVAPRPVVCAYNVAAQYCQGGKGQLTGRPFYAAI